MAQAAGHRIAQIIEEHNLGPVAAVASSPLVRCIETSMAFLPLLPSGGSDLKIFPDNSLLEFLSEGWYRSWAVMLGVLLFLVVVFFCSALDICFLPLTSLSG